jgi:hypothetical protein
VNKNVPGAVRRYNRLDGLADAILCRSENLRTGRKTARGISQAKKKETTMSQRKFPAGWDEDKVRRVLAHYEEQTGEDALLEDEAGIEPSETVMNVPHDLVPKVRELIAKQRR